MPVEGFEPYKTEDAEKYNRLRWWHGITWRDMFDKATDLYPAKLDSSSPPLQTLFSGRRT